LLARAEDLPALQKARLGESPDLKSNRVEVHAAIGTQVGPRVLAATRDEI
jgi:hypothetical protein